MPSLLMRPSRTEPIPSSPSPKKPSSGPPPVISGARPLRPRSLLPQPRPSSPPSLSATTSSSSLGRSISGSFRKSFGVSPKAKDKDESSGRKSADWELVEEEPDGSVGSSSVHPADPSSLGRSYGKGKQRERRESQAGLSASTNGISRLATFSRSRASKVTSSPSPTKKTKPLPSTSPTRTTNSSRAKTSSATAAQPRPRPAPLGTPAPPSAFSSSLANVPGTPNSPSPVTRSNSGSLLFVPPPPAGSDELDKKATSAMGRSVSNPLAKKEGGASSTSSGLPLSRPSSSSGRNKENTSTQPTLLPSASIRPSASSSIATKPTSGHRPKSSSPQSTTTASGRAFPASASISSIPAPPPPAAARRGHKVSLSMSVAPSSLSSSIPVVAPRAAGGLPRPTTAGGRGSLVPSASRSSKLAPPKAGGAGLMPFPSEKEASGGLKNSGSLGRVAGTSLRQPQGMPRSALSLIGGEMARPVKGVGTPARKVEELQVEEAEEGGLPSRLDLSYPSPAAPHPSQTASVSTSTPSHHPHPTNPLLSFSRPSDPLSSTAPFLTPSAQTRSTPKLAPRSSLFDYEAMVAASALHEDASLLIEDLDVSNMGPDTPGVDSPPIPRRRRSSTSNSNSTTHHQRRTSSRREASSSSTDVFTPPPPVPAQLDRAPSHIPILSTHLEVIPSPSPADISAASLQSRLSQSLLAQAELKKALASSKGRVLELEALVGSGGGEEKERDREAWAEERNEMDVELEATREVVSSLEARVNELELELASLRASHAGELARAEEENFSRLDEVAREFRALEDAVGRLERDRRERVGWEWEEVVRREREEGEMLREERDLVGLLLGGVVEGLERRLLACD